MRNRIFSWLLVIGGCLLIGASLWPAIVESVVRQDVKGNYLPRRQLKSIEVIYTESGQDVIDVKETPIPPVFLRD